MTDEQVFVVSDIHLGEDLVEHGPASLLRYVSRLNEQFVAFLGWVEAQATRKKTTLVINGDMFDFIKVSLRPAPREAYLRWQADLSKKEAKLGLENTPERVVWKLERIVENHRPLFLALAHFVGAGHRLQIVAGNHDREFYYPEVMAALGQALSDLFFSQNPTKDGASARQAFAERVGFSMWFHYTANGIYIEHGHQYDPYCSFEYLLAPLKKRGELKVALPLSHDAIPYFSNLVGDLSTHNIDMRGPTFYLKALWDLGPRNFGAFVATYTRVITAIVSEAGGKSRLARKALAALHESERDKVSARYGLPSEVVRLLDEQHATPAEFSTFKMIQCFYADRFLLVLATIALLLVEEWLIDKPSTRIAALVGTLSAAAGTAKVLARLRRVDVRAQLRRGAEAVFSILRPRVIVFGHSHKPEALALGETGWYLNIGSWISRATFEDQVGWGMTFAWLDPGEDRASGLYRWQGKQKEATIVQSLEKPLPATKRAAATTPEERSSITPQPCPE